MANELVIENVLFKLIAGIKTDSFLWTTILKKLLQRLRFPSQEPIHFTSI